jgi:hypothetical protein
MPRFPARSQEERARGRFLLSTITREGRQYSCRDLRGWVGRIGDRGLLVSLPRVQGAAGSARSESPRSGRQGRRVACSSPRARGPAPPGGAAAPSCRGWLKGAISHGRPSPAGWEDRPYGLLFSGAPARSVGEVKASGGVASPAGYASSAASVVAAGREARRRFAGGSGRLTRRPAALGRSEVGAEPRPSRAEAVRTPRRS